MRQGAARASSSSASGTAVGPSDTTLWLSLLGFPTAPKPKEIKVETFRIDYLIRTLEVEKLSLQPIRL